MLQKIDFDKFGISKFRDKNFDMTGSDGEFHETPENAYFLLIFLFLL